MIYLLLLLLMCSSTSLFCADTSLFNDHFNALLIEEFTTLYYEVLTLAKTYDEKAVIIQLRKDQNVKRFLPIIKVEMGDPLGGIERILIQNSLYVVTEECGKTECDIRYTITEIELRNLKQKYLLIYADQRVSKGVLDTKKWSVEDVKNDNPEISKEAWLEILK